MESNAEFGKRRSAHVRTKFTGRLNINYGPTTQSQGQILASCPPHLVLIGFPGCLHPDSLHVRLNPQANSDTLLGPVEAVCLTICAK